MQKKTTTGRKTTARKQRRTTHKKEASRTQRFLAQIKGFGSLVRQHIIIAGLICVCLIALLTWGIIALFDTPEIGYEVGMQAPQFELQTLDRQTITSNDLLGNVSVIAFWRPAQWNQTTDWEKIHLAEQLQKIQNTWAASEVSVLAIVLDSDKEAAQWLATEEEIAFPIAVDPSGNTFASFGIVYEPTQVFIDKEGIIRAIVPGLFQAQLEIDAVISNIQRKGKSETSRPVIADIEVALVTDKRAEISFITDKPAIAWLISTDNITNQGNRSNITATPPDSPTAEIHSLELANLEAETTYYFRAYASSDTDGKYPAQSREYTFTTLVDTIPPAILNVEVADVTDSSLTITWSTDEPATTHAEYPVDHWPNTITASNDTFVMDHSITLNGLKPDTIYFITLKSKDPAGHESVFVSPTIRTLLAVGNKVGMHAPDFTLPALDGTTATLSDHHGKIIMVNFWLTHCPSCQAETPYIQALYDKWPEDKLAILAINFREDHKTVRDFMNSNGLTFPVLLDLEGQVDAQYNPEAFPTTYFIDTKGIIRQIELGRFRSLEEIEEILLSIQ